MSADRENPRPVRGTERRRGLRYELIGCALHGHELAGTDAERIREDDALIARRDSTGLRWHRCLRCDGWIPTAGPSEAKTEFIPERSEITLPLRGKPLRDRYVLRLIALDRIVHFLVLGALGVAVFVFTEKRDSLSGTFYRVMDALQNGVGGPGGISGHGLIGELNKAFDVRTQTLWLIGLVLLAYAALEGVEAIGLWKAKRWAEYLTFLATTLLLIPEVYELTGKISPLKILTLIINLAVVVYLLFAKRLFGLRGGGGAEQRQREHDSGWAALERVQPGG